MVEISESNEIVNQLVLTFTIVVLLAFFIWNKYRYDAISVAALIFLVTISSIPGLEVNIINIDEAFLGFANPAVTIARMFTVSFTGINPSTVIFFISCQVIGMFAAYILYNQFFKSK